MRPNSSKHSGSTAQRFTLVGAAALMMAADTLGVLAALCAVAWLASFLAPGIFPTWLAGWPAAMLGGSWLLIGRSRAMQKVRRAAWVSHIALTQDWLEVQRIGGPVQRFCWSELESTTVTPSGQVFLGFRCGDMVTFYSWSCLGQQRELLGQALVSVQEYSGFGPLRLSTTTSVAA